MSEFLYIKINSLKACITTSLFSIHNTRHSELRSLRSDNWYVLNSKGSYISKLSVITYLLNNSTIIGCKFFFSRLRFMILPIFNFPGNGNIFICIDSFFYKCLYFNFN